MAGMLCLGQRGVNERSACHLTSTNGRCVRGDQATGISPNGTLAFVDARNQGESAGRGLTTLEAHLTFPIFTPCPLSAAKSPSIASVFFGLKAQSPFVIR